MKYLYIFHMKLKEVLINNLNNGSDVLILTTKNVCAYMNTYPKSIDILGGRGRVSYKPWKLQNHSSTLVPSYCYNNSGGSTNRDHLVDNIPLEELLYPVRLGDIIVPDICFVKWYFRNHPLVNNYVTVEAKIPWIGP